MAVTYNGDILGNLVTPYTSVGRSPPVVFSAPLDYLYSDLGSTTASIVINVHLLEAR